MELLKLGDKIGTTDFTVKKIVKSIVNRYDARGRKKRVRTTFYLISNSKGHQRVLNWKKKGVNDSLMYFPTFGNNQKYKTWNMIKIHSIVSQ